jgi:arginine exporter protein ArgO
MTARAQSRTMAQTAALVVGVVFLLVGILGFIPGITTNYGDMTFAGHDSGAELLGIFQVNVLHNIVHLLFAVGILMARTHSSAVTYLIGGGIIYAVVWLYGLAIDLDSTANFISLNRADNWLHLALAVGMVGLGVLFARPRDTEGDGRARAGAV